MGETVKVMGGKVTAGNWWERQWHHGMSVALDFEDAGR